MGREQAKTIRRMRPAGWLAAAVVFGAGVFFTLRDMGALGRYLSFTARSLAGGVVAPDRTDVAGDVNVVLFVIDTLRADRLNTYGYDGHVTSPNIDALARQGVVFEQAYAPAPWTLPSMASVMTSQFPCEHGLLSTRQRFAADVTTLPEILRSVGFTTIGVYANTIVGPGFGFGAGYDFYEESVINGGAQVEVARRMYAGRPFFLYVHNLEPHNPQAFAPAHTPGFRVVSDAVRMQIARHYRGYRGATWRDFEAGLGAGATDVTAEQDEHVRALVALRDDYSELYDASVRIADARLGEVVDVLKRRGEWDRTLFIVTSDHGEELHEHGGWSHDQSVYEELVRVPLIIRFPGDAHAGSRIADVASLVDLLPTVVDAVGRPELAGAARGESLLPRVRGQAYRPAGVANVTALRHNVMSSYPRWQRKRGDINLVVRQDEWKAVWNVQTGSLELYNLAGDPGERRNIALDHSDVAAALQQYAETWYEQCGRWAADAPGAVVNELDDEDIQQLRTLGYVE